MKHKSLISALTIATFIMLTACEEIIEFKGKETTPKIVLYAILQADSVITVNISESYSVIDNDHTPAQITDAVVRLYRDGTEVGVLSYEAPDNQPGDLREVTQSRYVSDGIKPLQGSIYRISVEVPGLKSVTAETSLPEPVPVTLSDTSIIERYDIWTYIRARVRFTDPAEDENYYMVSMRKIQGIYNGNPSLPYNPETGITIYQEDYYVDNTDEPLLNQNEDDDLFGIYYSNYFNVFTDELISGKQYDLSLRMDYSMPDTTYHEFKHFKINLISITYDLFLYLQSYSAHMQTRDDFMSEPVIVYSNVENGLGIVGAIAPSITTVEIGRYPVEGVKYRVAEPWN